MAVVDAATGQKVDGALSTARRPGIPAKDRPRIPDNEFTVTVPAEENRAAYRRRREDRDDQQLKVDALVQEMYKDWVEQGRSINWVDVPIRVWTVSLGHEEAALFMIRKACRLLGRKPWFGHMAERTTAPPESKKVFDIPFAITSTTARMKGKPRNDADDE